MILRCVANVCCKQTKSIYYRTKPRSPTSIHWAFKSHLSGSVLFAPKYDTYNVTRASKSKHESHCISWAVFSYSFSHLLSSLEILLISILSHWSRIKRHIYTHRHKYISINKYIHKYKNIYTDTYSPINNLLYTQSQKVKHMYTPTHKYEQSCTVM